MGELPAIRLDRRSVLKGGGALVVRDWEGLQAAGEFTPRYLHNLASGL